MPSENTHDVEALGSDGPSPDGSPVIEPESSFPPPTGNPDPDAREVSDLNDPDSPVLVGVAFENSMMAQEYLLAMGRLRQDGSLKLKDAVVVTKSTSGDVKVTETIDPTPGRSALSGAMWTGLLGLVIGGPVGWLAGLGIGAASGAVTAKIIDLGIPDEWVSWFKEAVRPGTSAVVILAEQVDMRALEREALRFPGAEVIESTLPQAVIDHLAAAFEAR